MIRKFFSWLSKRPCLNVQDVIDAMPAMVIITDKTGTIWYVNHHVGETLQYTNDELLGERVEILMDRHMRESHIEMRESYLKNDSPPRHMVNATRVFATRKDQSIVPLEVALNQLTINHKSFTVVTMVDVTNRVEYEKSLQRLAYYDPLTNLPNRLYVNNLAEKIYADYIENGRHYSVLLVDADNFKDINDTFGHAGGDFILERIAFYMTKTLNTTSIEGVAARLGGDEFVIVLHINDRSEIKYFINTLCNEFDTPIELEDGRKHKVGLSVGVSVTGDDYTDNTLSDMMRAADLALYKSKEMGKHRVTFYTKDIEKYHGN